MNLSTDIEEVKGVGKATAPLLKRLGIYTVKDLLNHFPHRYEDYSVIAPIKKLRPGPVTIKAQFKKISSRYGKKRGLHITQAIVYDESGSVQVVWFNQPYRAASIEHTKEYYISGTYDFTGQHLSILNPSIEKVDAFPTNTARILPIYPETKGLKSTKIRTLMAVCEPLITSVKDPLPEDLCETFKIEPLSETIHDLHFPSSTQQIKRTRFMLGFRELFTLALASQLLRTDLEKYRSKKIPIDAQVVTQFVANLPFTLTDTQKKVVWRILKDMAEKTHPMNRMIEGDVGSGKTVIAAIAAQNVVHHGGQVAVMAPTELLAYQHLQEFRSLFQSIYREDEIVFLSGSLTKIQRKQVIDSMRQGTARIIIGTHALFQDSLEAANIELLVIDEQHRFGVNQREALLAKASRVPHVLTMTATPIPRSLALVLYGELDVSILDEKPPGRKPIHTHLVSLSQRLEVFKEVLQSASARNKVYVVCPNIDSNEQADSIELIESWLQKHFPKIRYGVIHGRLKQHEKDTVMQEFAQGDTHILLATTVIEVGVNVVTASTMMILSPERFGLAQLHQLRGRVGRGNQAGVCYLCLGDNQAPSKRLRMIERMHDGFKLAEADLELRGPGALYGTRQSGALDLRMASLTDARMVKLARDAAVWFVKSQKNLVEYTQLHRSVTDVQKVTNLN